MLSIQQIKHPASGNATIAFFTTALVGVALGTSLVFSGFLPAYLWKEVVLLISIGLLLVCAASVVKVETISFNKLDLCIAIFLLYTGVNSIAHYTILQTSIFQFLLIIALLLFYILVRLLINALVLKSCHVWLILTAIFVFQIAIGLGQVSGVLPSANRFFSVTGAFSNSGTFANYLCILVGFIGPFVLYYSGKKTLVFFSLLLFLVLAVYLILVSASRTAYTGFFVFLLFFLYKRYYRKKTKTFLVISLLSFFIISLAFYLITYRVAGFKESSATGRLFIWQISSKLFLASPLFGVGISNFATKYQFCQAGFFKNKTPINSTSFYDIAGDTRFAFNDYIQILCEEGIIGMAIFVCLIYVVVKLIFRKSETKQDDNPVLMQIECALIVLLVCSLTSYGLMLIEFKVLFLFLLAAYSSLCPSVAKVCDLAMQKQKIFMWSISGILFVAYGVWRAGALGSISNYGSSASIREKRFLIGDTPLYLMTLSELLVHENKMTEAIYELEKLKLINPDKNIYYYLGKLYEDQRKYNLAEVQYRTVYYTIPNLIYPKFLLSKLYIKTQQYDKFQEIASKALAMKTKIDSDETEQIKIQIRDLFIRYRR